MKNPPSIYLTYGLKSFNFDLAVVLRPAWADAKPTRRGKVKYCPSKEKTKETTQSSCSLSLYCVKQKPRQTNAYVGVFSFNDWVLGLLVFNNWTDASWWKWFCFAIHPNHFVHDWFFAKRVQHRVRDDVCDFKNVSVVRFERSNWKLLFHDSGVCLVIVCTRKPHVCFSVGRWVVGVDYAIRTMIPFDALSFRSGEKKMLSFNSIFIICSQ